MIRVIDPDKPVDLTPSEKFYYDYWKSFIPSYMPKFRSLEIPSFLNSYEDLKRWLQRSPREAKDKAFYAREIAWISRCIKPYYIIEIGTDIGISTAIFHILNRDSFIYTIDIRKHTYLPNNKKVEVGYIPKRLFPKSNKIKYITGNSADVLPILLEKEVSRYSSILFFIDGDHSESAVYTDTQNCWKEIQRRLPSSYKAIIWHDCDENTGVKKAILKWSAETGQEVYRFADSYTAWRIF